MTIENTATAKDWRGNYNSIYKIIGASNHTDKERQPNDYYATSPIVIDKLLEVEKPYHRIWECAVGGGHLANRLKDFGYEVVGSDIVDRGYEDTIIKDFLADEPTDGLFDILTNPPYKYAKEFVLRALEVLPLGQHCYMFLKLTFLEGKARYQDLFKDYPPETVYVFSERVLCAKNAEFDKMKESGGSAVAYAWFVWKKGRTGTTTQIKWI